MGDFNFNYVPSDFPDPYPPAIASYVNSISAKVGAEVPYMDANEDVYSNFAATGTQYDFYNLVFANLTNAR